MSLLRRIVVVSSKSEIQQAAQQVGKEVFVADDLVDALDICQTVDPELVVVEDTLSPEHVRDLRDRLNRSNVTAPLIVLADESRDRGDIGQYLTAGASDVGIGHTGDKLAQVARSLVRAPQTEDAGLQTNDLYVDESAASVQLVGRSKAIRKTLRMIHIVASSLCDPVLIVGETGTGKELAATAIHKIRNPHGQFVAVNCAALTANLLESELFGHERGAFTGADREKTGLLELAGAGTIFLDEISEMPLDLQAKLLRVLQEKTFRRVGGVKDIVCRATIIASSNRNLPNEVQANRFRRDLYYRLNICPITMPALRSPERRDDIALLARYFVQTSNIRGAHQTKITSITKLALEALEKHDWPGNVRELRNVVERAILLEKTDTIGLDSIVIEPAEADQADQISAISRIQDFSLAKAERELIALALQRTGWQKTQAAALLGITRATLYAKVKQYNIHRISGDDLQDVGSDSPAPQPVGVG